MIVCSCNVVSDKVIEAVIEGMLEVCADIGRITSGGVLRILDKRYNCLSCQPLMEATVARTETLLRQRLHDQVPYRIAAE